MELNSGDRQILDQLIERLRLSITQLAVPAEDSRGISMVRSDLQYVAAELEDMVESSWHLRDDEDDYNGFGFQPTGYSNPTIMSVVPPPPPEPPCEHKKVYAPFLYTNGIEPKMPWICEECLQQGSDPGWQVHLENKDAYRVLLNKVINQVKRGEK